MSLCALRSKRPVSDIWPIRNKKFFVLTDPQNIMKGTTDAFATLSTISYLLERQGIVVVAASFGELRGIPLSSSRGLREEAIEAFRAEGGMGYNNFFATLPSHLKAEVLKVASGGELPPSLPDGSTTGKNEAFAQLSMHQRAAALRQVFPKVEFAPCSTHAFVSQLSKHFLGVDVKFAPDTLSAPTHLLKPGTILVLENLKFYQNETSLHPEERMAMAEVLASYADVFVNESFATVNSVHASNTELPKILFHGAAGFSLSRELTFFSRFLTQPPRPIAVVVAGRYTPKKIRMIRSLVGKVDKILLGGMIIMPFLLAKGLTVDKSFNTYEQVKRKPLNANTDVEELSISCVNFAREIIALCEKNGVELVLPVDHVVTKRITRATEDSAAIVESVAIPSDVYVVDCGFRTISLFAKCIRPCPCVFWTGTFGCTRTGYTEGTYTFARALAEEEKLSIVCGSSTTWAVQHLGLASHFTHVSSGGSTCLDVLQGHPLPGVETLSDVAPTTGSRSLMVEEEALRNLPLFSGCSSQQVKAVARKFNRHVHARGDYLTYEGDRHVCMWLVAQGGLVSHSGDASVTLPSRYIGHGQTVGMYDFITQSFATETVQAVEDKTVTYQLAFSSLQDLFNEQPDIAAQLLQNVSEVLRVMAIDEYRKQNSLLNVLKRAASISRVPTFLVVPKGWGFAEDVVQDIVSSIALRRITEICTGQVRFSLPQIKSFDWNALLFRNQIACTIVGSVVRNIVYHSLIRFGVMPATMLSSVVLSPFRLKSMGVTWNDLTYRVVLVETLVLALGLWTPIATHAGFLVVQRRVEALLRCRCTAMMRLLITVVVKLVFGVLSFPVTFRPDVNDTPTLVSLFGTSAFKYHQWKQVLLILLRCVVHVLLNGVRGIHKALVEKRKNI